MRKENVIRIVFFKEGLYDILFPAMNIHVKPTGKLPGIKISMTNYDNLMQEIIELATRITGAEVDMTKDRVKIVTQNMDESGILTTEMTNYELKQLASGPVELIPWVNLMAKRLLL